MMKKISFCIALLGLLLVTWSCGGGSAPTSEQTAPAHTVTSVPSATSQMQRGSSSTPTPVPTELPAQSTVKSMGETPASVPSSGSNSVVNQSTYDINCMVPFLGRNVVDAIFDDLGTVGKLRVSAFQRLRHRQEGVITFGG